MTSGITSIVDQLTGRARIPEGAAPVLRPSLAMPGDKPRKPKPAPIAKPKRDNEAAILGAIDFQEGRTVHEIAQRSGASKWLVYKYLRRFLESGVVAVDEPRGHRVGVRYRRVR